MPKKKNRRVHPSEKRHLGCSRDQLSDNAASLESLAGELRTIAGELDRLGMEHLPMDGSTQGERGLKIIERFVKNARKGVVDAT